MNRDDDEGQPLGTLVDALNVLTSITWPGGAVIIRRSSSPSRRRTRGPPEAALMVPTDLASIT
jgi:hypothetical protein